MSGYYVRFVQATSLVGSSNRFKLSIRYFAFVALAAAPVSLTHVGDLRALKGYKWAMSWHPRRPMDRGGWDKSGIV